MSFLKKVPAAAAVAALLMASAAQAASPRPDWVVNELYNFNHKFAATNSTELAMKMNAMAAGPFAFYRGTAHLFFKDMASMPAAPYTNANTGYTWLTGDMHIANFGSIEDSKGNQVLAVGDFDEGSLGQYTWDLRRLAASMVLAGRDNGISDADITTAINTLVSAYANQMDSFKGTSGELTFMLKSGDTSGMVQDMINAGKNGTRSGMLDKYTTVTNGVRSFLTNDRLAEVSATTKSAIAASMNEYVASIASSKRFASSYYKVKDVRQRLGSGVGSLGKFRYFVLIDGPSTANSDDVILEVKQATPSVVDTAAPARLPASTYGYSEGCRGAMTMKAQLLNADVLAGCTTIQGNSYFVREKSPKQEDFDTTLLSTGGKLNTAATYIGKALASAHALADQDYNANIVPYSIDKQIADAITSKSGLASSTVSFAFEYAAQVNYDWAEFVKAKNAGKALY